MSLLGIDIRLFWPLKWVRKHFLFLFSQSVCISLFCLWASFWFFHGAYFLLHFSIVFNMLNCSFQLLCDSILVSISFHNFLLPAEIFSIIFLNENSSLRIPLSNAFWIYFYYPLFLLFFYSIFLSPCLGRRIRPSHETNSDSRSRKIDSIAWWEELQSLYKRQDQERYNPAAWINF